MLLDSNILIGYLNGDEEVIAAVQRWRASNVLLYLSSISAIESLSLSTLTATDLSVVDKFLDGFIIIPADMSIVHAAASLRRAHRLTIADSIITATAVVHRLPLATRDKKIRAVPGVVLAEI
jgi:toxin FitB